MKRIGILQVWQESNSFNPVLTTKADFEAFGMGSGEEALTKFGTGEEVGGFLRGLKAWRELVEPVGLVLAQAWPGGSISKETKQWLCCALREQLDAVGQLDGVLFSLHGALVAEDEADVDGFLLEQVRQAVGPDVPLVATLDCHAYWTPRMGRVADALVAYHTNPHLDRWQTGERAAHVLERILAGAKPAVATIRLPMLITGEVNTTTGPVLGPVFDRLREVESRADVLSASILMVQPWVDVPELASAIVVFTEGKSVLARELAEELAQMYWQRREQMTFEFLDAQQSVTAALACEGQPVVIADGADATNSGAPGDSVHLLREMLKRDIPGGALLIMVDPQAVAYARAVGVGEAFQFAVGGKRDHVFSQPLPISGEVLSLQPARYVLSGHGGDNLPIDMGDSAAVRTGDVTLLLVEKTGPGSTPMMYRCVGLEPQDFKIVVVKSPAGFRAEFEPFAAGIVLSACPGCASPRLTEMPYKKISRPIWPLDRIEDWRSVEWTKSSDSRYQE